MGGAPGGRDPGWWFVLASFALACVAAAVLALAPMMMVSQGSSQTTSGRSTMGGSVSPAPQISDLRTQETRALPDAQGWASVAVVAVPPLVASALPLLPRGRRRAFVLRTVAAVLLWAWGVLGALSVGIFYLPSAILMLIAAILARSHSQEGQRSHPT